NIYIRTCDGLVGPRQTWVGLPQGGILSPLLYIIQSYDFEPLFNNSNVNVYQFADVYAITYQSRNIENTHQVLNKAITKAKKWFNDNGSPISQEKTAVITFTRKRYRPPATLRLADFDIQYKTSVKYLGLILDSKLNWKDHINYTSRYWHNKSLSLLEESYSWISQFKEDIYQSDILPGFLLDYTYYENIPKTAFLDMKDNEELNNKIFQLASRWNNYMHIFTDGFLKNNKAGCAAYEDNNNTYKQYKLPPRTSSFTAELVAIREALKNCVNNEYNKDSIAIFTDCKSAVLSIQSDRVTSESNHLIVDIIKLYNELVSMCKSVEIIWIKGHAGIKQNERVDHLAKKAIEIGETIKDFKIPSTDIRKTIRQRLNLNWHEWFVNYEGGNNYKSIDEPIIHNYYMPD
ncbi:hypothetical protein NQ315_014750, partial [Exocentrus adspersus]